MGDYITSQSVRIIAMMINIKIYRSNEKHMKKIGNNFINIQRKEGGWEESDHFFIGGS